MTSGDIGGGQLVSLKVATALLSRGFGVRFASPSRGAFTKLSDALAATDIVGGTSLRDLGAVPRIARYLRGTRAALVHTHTPAAATILWRLGARLASVPIVNHVHIFNYFGPPGIRSSAARKIDALTRRIPSAYIAVSGNTRDALVADGYDEERITTIYNSIPWPRRPRTERPGGGDPVIGCIGRVTPVKGQADLLEAFALVRRKYTGAKLWIVGGAADADRSYFQTLESRARAPDLAGAVTFTGNRDDVTGLLPQMTVLVLPSRHEAFPLVLLEAMSVGVPVIATPVGGVTELVKNGEDGLLVTPGDVTALAQAIDQLLREPTTRETLACRAYESVWTRFDDSRTLDRVVELISREVTNANRN